MLYNFVPFSRTGPVKNFCDTISILARLIQHDQGRDSRPRTYDGHRTGTVHRCKHTVSLCAQSLLHFTSHHEIKTIGPNLRLWQLQHCVWLFFALNLRLISYMPTWNTSCFLICTIGRNSPSVSAATLDGECLQMLICKPRRHQMWMRSVCSQSP